jgi:hypothetical protein
MNYLFDVGDSGKPAKKRKRAVVEVVEKPKPPAKPVGEATSVGTIAGGEACYRCGADFYDIVEQRRDCLLVQCAFCQTYDFATSDRGRVAPAYIFSGGRFSGMTIAQVANSDVGISYLRWAAEKSPRPDEQAAAKMWLDQHGRDR